MQAYVLAGLFAGHFQPRKGFGSSFVRPGLDSSGSVADSDLGDEAEQQGLLLW